MLGDSFGSHRVLEPEGALPQAALKLDADFSRLYDDELLIDVDTLNVDAASFRQMLEAAHGDEAAVATRVLEIVSTRGKQHNPVTGSGGMLLGRAARVGPSLPERMQVAVGTRIATLVSLTLTPLRLDAVGAVRAASAQLDVKGQAVLFASGCFAVMPEDMPERLALAALDVCGAPAQVARVCGAGDLVVVLGAGGKSGVLSAVAARRAVGEGGRVIGVESNARAAAELESLSVCDAVVSADATRARAVRDAVLGVSGGREADVCVSCVNVEGAELGAVLSTRPRGRIFYFATTTSFTRAALGAEGLSRDVDMFIGNGYAEGHAELTLELLRTEPKLRALFERRYA